MIEINGQSFESWEQAQEYIEEQKQAEAKAKAEAEQKEKFAQVRDYLSSRLETVVVTDEEGTYLVCAISDDDKKCIYPTAVAEAIFGDQFDVCDTTVNVNYNISKIKPTNAVKDFIAQNHKFGGKCKEQWFNVKIGEAQYRAVFLQDFCYKSQEEFNENKKSNYSVRDLDNGVHVVTCNGFEDMMHFLRDLFQD